MGRKRLDVTGQKFGRLTAISFDKMIDKVSWWNWRCDCGNLRTLPMIWVKSGKSSSCGCFRREFMSKKQHIHGFTKLPEYPLYRTMIARCTNTKHVSYQRYGALGVTVCDRWINGEDGLTGFECFMLDMGPRPDGFSVERKDSNKGYEPDNCIWANNHDQTRNKRNNVWVTYNGHRMILTDACQAAGLTLSIVGHRLNKGWTMERALNTPRLR